MTRPAADPTLTAPGPYNGGKSFSLAACTMTGTELVAGRERRACSSAVPGAGREGIVMASLIQDRGRGPEIAGTRITVYHLLQSFLDPTVTEEEICRVY